MTTVDDLRSAPSGTDLEPEHDSRRRRPGLVWAALGAVLIAAGVGTWLWNGTSSTEPTPASTGPAATAVVERGTIAASAGWEGTLGHGQRSTVTGRAEGTATRLPDLGTAVGRGAELYRVDEQPVTLLVGEVPMFRRLGPGDAGVDVAQLEANLVALGYVGFAADDTYTAATADAVRAWQAETGAAETGVVTPATVVFLPQAGRVDRVHAGVGDLVRPGAPILDITGTRQVVTVEAEVDDRDLLEIDAPVEVVLPDGREVAGTISSVAVVDASPDGGDGFGGDGMDTESILEVEIALADDVDDGLVGATVEVVVAIDERRDVLLVPVNALLALAEGGFGLEVVHDDGTTSIVAVDTGLFADGKVEVTGDDIAEGTVVGTAGR